LGGTGRNREEQGGTIGTEERMFRQKKIFFFIKRPFLAADEKLKKQMFIFASPPGNGNMFFYAISLFR